MSVLMLFNVIIICLSALHSMCDCLPSLFAGAANVRKHLYDPRMRISLQVAKM